MALTLCLGLSALSVEVVQVRGDESNPDPLSSCNVSAQLQNKTIVFLMNVKPSFVGLVKLQIGHFVQVH